MKDFPEAMYLNTKDQRQTNVLSKMISFYINSFFLLFLPFFYFIIREKLIIMYQNEISIDFIASFIWIMLLFFDLYYLQ